VTEVTKQDIAGAIAEARAKWAELVAKMNALKAERDAFLERHREVYQKERDYANVIKLLSIEAGALRDTFGMAVLEPKPPKPVVVEPSA